MGGYPRDAAAMVREMRCFALLDGARGRPTADVAAIEALLVRISDFVVRRADRIEEMDLSPVWVGAKGEGAMPFDAMIIERVEQGACVQRACRCRCRRCSRFLFFSSLWSDRRSSGSASPCARPA
ncbi:acetate--CoA ligase family protein [Variovorax paradoxus]|uniref:acetate--CoA ligase family protein n=1 Tax=Variovorax paradoxus TaxID=34073 RepID=UPI0004800627|nr:acetate--CoA ligase family protein [Variovorax paradoxus]